MMTGVWEEYKYGSAEHASNVFRSPGIWRLPPFQGDEGVYAFHASSDHTHASRDSSIHTMAAGVNMQLAGSQTVKNVLRGGIGNKCSLLCVWVV